MTQRQGPLSGIRVIELAGIGPGPYCGQLMADMGADVVVIDRKGGLALPVEGRGKRSVTLNLKATAHREAALKLIETAHVLIEGYRPGVAERLGLGPEACQARNPKLVYGRMTGWGQDGPMAPRAGHDLNYISLTGALNAMGKPGELPSPPLNLVGDYGGGSMFLLSGILAALLQAEKTGKGDIIDAAIVDGTLSLMGIVHSLGAFGQWTTERGSNLLDGSAPFYRCYATSDNKAVAVGCLEPQFFAEMLERLEIASNEFGEQYDKSLWLQHHARLEQVFAAKTRDEWAEIFKDSDACVTPVLDYREAASHPHIEVRKALLSGEMHQPNVAPRFNGFPVETHGFAQRQDDSEAILAEIGLSTNDLSEEA